MASNLSVAVFLCCIFLICSTAAARDKFLPRRTTVGTAERLIKSLNLFPKDSVNIYKGDGDGAETNSIVEKSFRFPILSDSGPSVATLGHHAGYFSLPNTIGARMFYFFFESRTNQTDEPVVIWLSGGPGCSSSLALFYENGPFKFTKDLSLAWNEYGWDLASNIIFVDQPTGTGFSYTNDTSDLRHDETGVSNDLYNFLQAFFTKHPEFAKNDFFVTGESYAGHYVPAFSSRIDKGNKAKEGVHINLKGFAIGNGLTDPAIQYPAYIDYGLSMKLITQSDYNEINSELIPTCKADEQACANSGGNACLTALSSCNSIFQSILNIAGNINFYDIRKQCTGPLCYDFSGVETFMNEVSVRKALGVGDIDFVSCSDLVHENMMSDWMHDFEPVIPALLEEGIQVLVYAGEYDLICNWMGNSNWVDAMKWSGQIQFGNASTVAFTVDGVEAGLLKSYGPLSFLKVHNAGHMVPMDQPKASLQMLRSWMKGKVASEKKASVHKTRH